MKQEFLTVIIRLAIKTTAYYYVTASGRKVIQEFIDSLEKVQQTKVLRIIKAIQVYGLESVVLHLKKLANSPL